MKRSFCDKMKLFFYAVCSLLVVCSFVACSNLYSDAGNKNSTDGDKKVCGVISGSIKTEGAVPAAIANGMKSNDKTKTAFPSIPTEDISYKIWATCQGKSDVVVPEENISTSTGADGKTTTTYSISISEEGDWTLHAEMYTGTSTLKKTIMSFVSDTTYTINETSTMISCDIELTPVETPSGTGTIDLLISRSEDLIGVVTAMNYKFNGVMNYADPHNFSSSIHIDNVASGISDIELYFYNSSAVKVFSCHEIINVFDNMTTDTWGKNGDELYLHVDPATGVTTFEITRECLDLWQISDIWVDSGAQSGGNGTVDNPFNTLSSAIDIATSPNVNYTIHLVGGISSAKNYIINSTTITKNITIVGEGANRDAVVIKFDTNTNNAYFIVKKLSSSPQAPNFILKNLTLTGRGQSYKQPNSKCIDIQSGSHVTLENVKINSFFSTTNGGAITGSSANLTICGGTEISSCGIYASDSNVNGGAIYMESGTILIDDAVIRDCYIAFTGSSQNGIYYKGGALYSGNVCTVKKAIFTGNSITSNSPNIENWGGAIYATGTLILGNGKGTTYESAGATVGGSGSDYYPDVIIGTGFYNGKEYTTPNYLTGKKVCEGGGVYADNNLIINKGVCIGRYDVMEHAKLEGSNYYAGNYIYLNNGTNGTQSRGAGLYCDNFLIQDCTIRYNMIVNDKNAHGVGIYGGDKYNTIKNSDISYNTAWVTTATDKPAGVGMMYGPDAYSNCNIVFDNVTIKNNYINAVCDSRGVGLATDHNMLNQKMSFNRLIFENNCYFSSVNRDDIFLDESGYKITLTKDFEPPEGMQSGDIIATIKFGSDTSITSGETQLLFNEDGVTAGSSEDMVSKYCDSFTVTKYTTEYGINDDGKLFKKYYFDSGFIGSPDGTKTLPYSAFGSLSNVPTNSIIYLKGSFAYNDGIDLDSTNYIFKKWTDNIPSITSNADDGILFNINNSKLTFRDIRLSGKISATNSTITLCGDTSIDYISPTITDGEAIILDSSNLVLKDNATVSGGTTSSPMMDDVLDIGVYAIDNSTVKFQDSAQITGGCLYIKIEDGTLYPTISITGPINYYGFKNQIYFDIKEHVSEHYISYPVISGSQYIPSHSYSDYFETHIDRDTATCSIRDDGKVNLNE